VERCTAQGMDVREAGQAARRQFGNVTALKERQRTDRGLLSPEAPDVRFGLRMLAKAAGVKCGGGGWRWHWESG
jgi:hypothetical protein